MKKFLLFLCATLLIIGAAPNVEALRFSPTYGDFGYVEIGNTFSQTFEIVNDDPYLVHLMTPFVLFSPDFSVSPPGSNLLSPDSTTNFDMAFTPTSTGIHIAAVVLPFIYNDDQKLSIGVTALPSFGVGIDSRSTSVPDASIMLLLGSSLMGLAVFSRKSKRT
jgi:HYDIN/CFA65/VesB-like, Ig-like domain